jgi:hypothetical protein
MTVQKSILQQLSSKTSYDRVKWVAYWLLFGEIENEVYKEVSSKMLFTESTWRIRSSNSQEQISISTMTPASSLKKIEIKHLILVPLKSAKADEVVDGLCLVLNELGIQRISIQVDTIGNFGRPDYLVDISRNSITQHQTVPSLGSLRGNIQHRGARPW